MNNSNTSVGGGAQPIRYGYIESAYGVVKDCQSGLASRMLYCVLSHIVGSLSAVLMPILVMIGTVGNLIVAYVMLGRLRPITRQNLYLGCIAIADILGLIFIGVFNGFLTKGLPWLTGGTQSFITYNLSEDACKASRFGMNFFHALTCLWLLVLVTDRVLVVYKPLAMKRYGKRWAAGALLVSLILAAVVALPNGVLMGFSYVRLPGNIVLIYCYRLAEAPRIFMIIYTVSLSSPPTLLIIIMLGLDLLLLKKVAAAMKERRKLTGGHGSGRSAADRNGTMIVLILAILYLVLHLPAAALRTTLEVSLYQLDLATNLDYLSLLANVAYSSLTIGLINQCVGFFVLFSRSQSFKRSTLELCCCCCGRLRNRLMTRSTASDYRSETRLELRNKYGAAAGGSDATLAAVLED